MSWSLFGTKCASCGRRTRDAVLGPTSLAPWASVAPMVCKACSVRLKLEAEEADARAKAKQREVKEAITRATEEKRRTLAAEAIHSLSDCHNSVTELMIGIQSGKFDPHGVAQMALDMLLKVPPNKDYYIKIESLLSVCGAQYWIGPLFTRLKEQPDSYAQFSEHLICDSYDGPQYLILGLKKDGNKDMDTAIPAVMRERLEAILSCAEIHDPTFIRSDALLYG